MTKKFNGSARWIGLILVLASMIFVFGQKSKALEKDDEANATAITVVREQHDKDMELVRVDLKTIIGILLKRP